MGISDRNYNYDVTVLMPVYNGSLFVTEAIESIKVQEGVRCKLIVFNDGSSDSTLEILCKFSGKNVHIINSDENIGYVRALNSMLPFVDSPYIARLDADDVAKPQRLLKQLTHIESKPSTLVLGSDFDYIDIHGSVLDRPTDRCSGLTPNSALLFENVICHPTVVLRSDVFSRVVPQYDPSILPAEDYDLWLKCSEVGDVEIHPEKLTKYRIHAKQITGQMEKSTYRKNAVIRMRHLCRTELLDIRFQAGGVIDRIKRIVEYEAEKYSLTTSTAHDLCMRYLQDVCISGALSKGRDSLVFTKSFLFEKSLNRSDKITLLRFIRKSLLF